MLLPSRLLALGAICICWLALAPASRAQESTTPALAGYLNHEQFSTAVKKLETADFAQVKSLGKSAGERDVWLVTIGSGKSESKPAIAIVGNVQGSLLSGGEVALRIAQQLVAKRDDESVKKLLERVTIYIIPRPDPDGSEKAFAGPSRVPAGNARPTDDDRDFTSGEDPPNDLNGDGFITQMRIEDPAGNLIVHPDDERILITADPKKNERGKYRVLTEGVDDDSDEQWNEDAGDGVAFDRNFTFNYRPFTANTGANAVSEPECRAIADFFFDHTNIAVVYTFTLDDNLFHPWKPNQQTERERIRKNILSADATATDFLGDAYKKIHGGSDAPAPPDNTNGAFSRWAYFHYGRWSLNARPWWVPKTDAKKEEGKKEEAKKEEPKEGDDAKDAENKDGEKKEAKKPSGEKRGSEQLNLLRWLKANDIDGFVAWKPIEHPDFPGKKVEVGGFKPLIDLNPPAKELDGLAEKQLKFLLTVPDYLPKLELRDAKAVSLGGGVVRITATAANTGYLPTTSEMGSVNGIPYPLQIELSLPKDAVLLQGSPRSELNRLSGLTGKIDRTWLVRFSGEVPAELKLRVWAPAVGEAIATIKTATIKTKE